MKKLVVAAAIALMVVALTACSGNSNNAADQSATQGQQTAQTDTNSANGNSNVANPMVEYADYEALGTAAGFPLITLLDTNEYQATSFYLIDNTIAQITYVKAKAKDPSKTEIILRIAKGTNDISGVEGVEFSPEELYGITVNTTVVTDTTNGMGDLDAAWFTYNDYAYSLTAQGVDSTEFENMLKEVVTLSGVKAQ